jgi:hypothetical protein
LFARLPSRNPQTVTPSFIRHGITILPHRLSPLESALMQVLILNKLNPFKMNTYEKTGGGVLWQPLHSLAQGRLNQSVGFVDGEEHFGGIVHSQRIQVDQVEVLVR